MIDKKLPLKIFIHVCDNCGVPIIELRKKLSKPEIMQEIIDIAFYNDLHPNNLKAISIFPCFNSSERAIASLKEKGIIYIAPDGKYYYN